MQRITRAVLLRQYNEDYELSVAPANLPMLQPNQVLVRLECASVSAADIRFLHGHCPVVRGLPAVPGFEASGTVVETGSRLKNWRFQGKRVGVFSLDSGLPGVWAEYAVVQSRHCFLLADSITFEQAASMFLTPLTICMFEEVLGKAKGVIQTGGNSAVARTLLRVCNYRGLACVCVISSPEEAQALVDLGAKYILLASDPEFESKATSMCGELKVTVGFDCLGGQVAGQVFNALQAAGTLYSYEEIQPAAPISAISPKALIFERKKIVGLNLLMWFVRKNALMKLHLCNHIQQYYFMYRQEVIGVFPMHEISQALQRTKEAGCQGKILLQLRLLPLVKQPSLPHEEIKQPGSTEIPSLPTNQHLLEEAKESDEEDVFTPPALPKSKAAIAIEAFPISEDAEEVEITSHEAQESL